MVKCCTYPTLRSLHLERGENQKLAFIAHTKKKKKSCKSNALQGESFGRNPKRFPGEGIHRGDRGDGII